MIIFIFQVGGLAVGALNQIAGTSEKLSRRQLLQSTLNLLIIQ